jgi:hypothetical protein
MSRALACAILACVALGGPAVAAPEVVHVPSEDGPTNQREADSLRPQLDAGRTMFFLEKPELSVGQSRQFIRWDWRPDSDGIVVRFIQGSRPAMEFKFASMPKIEVIHDTVIGASFYGVRLSEEWALWCQTDSSDLRLVCGKWMGAQIAARRLWHAALLKGRAEFEARFQETVARYPDPASRPELPEEARRFKVQAEAAVRDKRLADALKFYGQAVTAAMWWAEGYFNLALLYAEQKQHESAIRNMKRYLVLLPQAANARAAQDKIYEWESLPK